MPLDDAMGLLVKHFEQSVEMKAKSGAGPGENHPGDIVAVLDFLRENRPLSVMGYDKLIKYLCARRTQMLKTEYGDAVPANLARPPIGPPVDPAVKTKQEELQNKIGAILDGQKELFPSVRPDPEPQPPARGKQPRHRSHVRQSESSGGLRRETRRRERSCDSATATTTTVHCPLCDGKFPA